MIIVTGIRELNQHRSKISQDVTIGFVPTMGALHRGHESLIKKAKQETDFVIVSIFVNPLQFGENEDLDQYPRQLENDRQLCESLGIDLLFTPDTEEMKITSAKETTLVIPPTSITSVLCGRYRSGHFAGVATIVTKLFNVVRPDVAFFGQKDAQQVVIIKKMVEDLCLPVKIVTCPIVREESGLALSSRNQYLTPSQKKEALLLHNSLQLAQEAIVAGERSVNRLLHLIIQQFNYHPLLKLQYVQIVDVNTLQPLTAITDSFLIAIAAFCGKIRLIDNVIVTLKKPIIAIDGPAGAGKSTVSRRLAHNLGYLYLDTGAMYRSITWLVMNSNIDVHDQNAIAEVVKSAEIQLLPSDDINIPVTVKINDQDVTTGIRTPEVTANVSIVAAQKAVRAKLVQLQQEYGKKGGLVAEGRDIGTNVFPDAKVKIFLTATPEARAKRRIVDLQEQGETDISLEQLIADIKKRDHLDSTRELAPLTKAEDAMEIMTDDLTIEEVIEKINFYIEE